MASRAEEKQRRREERLAQEQAAAHQERRKRWIGVGIAGALVAASIAAIIVAVTVGGGESGIKSESPFGTHYEGLDDRRTAASVPTMAEAQTVGAAHFHPEIKVYVNGKQVTVPVNIGIDPANPPSEMAGLHTHDESGTIHNEAGTSAKLGQFFSVWGVPLSNTQLGPYRATRSKQVRMWVDGKPSREFSELQLADGQQVVVAYGERSDMPL
jgi:hypothetical protein